MIIVVIVLIAILTLKIFSKLKFGRTLMATLVEFYLKVTNRELSDNELIDRLNRDKQAKTEKVTPPKGQRRGLVVTEEDFFGMQVFHMKKSKGNVDSQKVLVYLHGGGYVRKPRYHHWKFFRYLAKKCNCKIVLPIYPKAPKHSVSEVFPLMVKFYKSIVEKYKKVILGGDSSGGGLAMSLCEEFSKQNIRQPDDLILLSPWVDVSLENPNIEKYQKIDPFISAKNERLWGKAWADGVDVKNYAISPLYGDLGVFKSVKLFVGTREILYPDVILTYNKLRQLGVKVKCEVGEGLNHVYPIYPIPEGVKSRKTIARYINEI